MSRVITRSYSTVIWLTQVRSFHKQAVLFFGGGAAAGSPFFLVWELSTDDLISYRSYTERKGWTVYLICTSLLSLTGFDHFDIIFLKKKHFIYLFLETEEGKEKEREETSLCGCLSCAPLLGTWPKTQACALIGNWTRDPLVHKPALNPLSHTSQGW